jgi:hypothetical protein
MTEARRPAPVLAEAWAEALMRAADAAARDIGAQLGEMATAFARLGLAERLGDLRERPGEWCRCHDPTVFGHRWACPRQAGGVR